MDALRGDGGPAIHVLFRKEDLDSSRIGDKLVVVVDVLFASTSIVAALDRGASVVHPARDAGEARELARRCGGGDPLLAGESDFRFIDGFAQPTPLALCRQVKPRGTVIYTTTNGTVALRACAPAHRVLVGALINAAATARALDADPDRSVVILCAGTAGAFNLEDFHGAGCLVRHLAERRTGCRLTDAALAARESYRAGDAERTLRRSLVGRLMHQWGLDDEVAFAARIDDSNLAAELREDGIRAVER